MFHSFTCTLCLSTFSGSSGQTLPGNLESRHTHISIHRKVYRHTWFSYWPFLSRVTFLDINSLCESLSSFLPFLCRMTRSTSRYSIQHFVLIVDLFCLSHLMDIDRPTFVCFWSLPSCGYWQPFCELFNCHYRQRPLPFLLLFHHFLQLSLPSDTVDSLWASANVTYSL